MARPEQVMATLQDSPQIRKVKKKLLMAINKAIHDQVLASISHPPENINVQIYQGQALRSFEEICRQYFNDPLQLHAKQSIDLLEIDSHAFVRGIDAYQKMDKVFRDHTRAHMDLLTVDDDDLDASQIPIK